MCPADFAIAALCDSGPESQYFISVLSCLTYCSTTFTLYQKFIKDQNCGCRCSKIIVNMRGCQRASFLLLPWLILITALTPLFVVAIVFGAYAIRKYYSLFCHMSV